MNKRDTFYFWYFVIHVPVTLLVDATMVIPKEWQLSVQKQLVGFHIAANKDFLLEKMPLWLEISGMFEVFVQLPIFVVAAVALRRQWRPIYLIMTIYGFNAFFTTLLCLAHIVQDGPAAGLTHNECINLFALYVPYFAIPLYMLVDCGFRTAGLMGKAKKD